MYDFGKYVFLHKCAENRCKNYVGLYFVLYVLKLVRGVNLYGSVKFAAYTYSEFVWVVPYVSRHLTDFHEGRY